MRKKHLIEIASSKKVNKKGDIFRAVNIHNFRPFFPPINSQLCLDLNQKSSEQNYVASVSETIN